MAESNDLPAREGQPREIALRRASGGGMMASNPISQGSGGAGAFSLTDYAASRRRAIAAGDLAGGTGSPLSTIGGSNADMGLGIVPGREVAQPPMEHDPALPPMEPVPDTTSPPREGALTDTFGGSSGGSSSGITLPSAGATNFAGSLTDLFDKPEKPAGSCSSCGGGSASSCPSNDFEIIPDRSGELSSTDPILTDNFLNRGTAPLTQLAFNGRAPDLIGDSWKDVGQLQFQDAEGSEVDEGKPIPESLELPKDERASVKKARDPIPEEWKEPGGTVPGTECLKVYFYPFTYVRELVLDEIAGCVILAEGFAGANKGKPIRTGISCDHIEDLETRKHNYDFIARYREHLRLAEEGKLDLTDEEIKYREQRIAELQKELTDLNLTHRNLCLKMSVAPVCTESSLEDAASSQATSMDALAVAWCAKREPELRASVALLPVTESEIVDSTKIEYPSLCSPCRLGLVSVHEASYTEKIFCDYDGVEQTDITHLFDCAGQAKQPPVTMVRYTAKVVARSEAKGVLRVGCGKKR